MPINLKHLENDLRFIIKELPTILEYGLLRIAGNFHESNYAKLYDIQGVFSDTTAIWSGCTSDFDGDIPSTNKIVKINNRKWQVEKIQFTPSNVEVIIYLKELITKKTK